MKLLCKQLGALVSALALSSGLAVAASPDELTKVTRNEDGCVAYFPPNFPLDIKWLGTCRDGLAEGIISFVGVTDNTDKTRFASGYVEGEISLTGANAYLFRCKYVRSRANGLCTSKNGNYRNYIAHFEDGEEREGSGWKEVVVGPEGFKATRQEGEFYAGRLNGWGKATFKSTYSDIELLAKISNRQWRTEGDSLIAEGMWRNGRLEISCRTRPECQVLRSTSDAQQSQAASQRQACAAQKQTCLASCGTPTYWNGSRSVENQSWSGCNTKCEQIRCN